MPTLTLRIEDGSEHHQNLEKAKEIFHCSTNTGAIYAALEYASEKERREEDQKNMTDSFRTATVKYSTLNRRVHDYFELQKTLIETPDDTY